MRFVPLAFVGVVCVLTGCGSGSGGDTTTGKRITLHTAWKPEATVGTTIKTGFGWNVTLTKAAIAMSGFYYFDGPPPTARFQPPTPTLLDRFERFFGLGTAWAHPGHYQAGTALGQVIFGAPTTFDLFSPGTKLPDGTGITGTYRSARVVLATPSSTNDVLAGHIAIAEGQATKADGSSATPIYFRLVADEGDVMSNVNEDAIDGCVLDEIDVENDGTITAEILPSVWLNLVDFSKIAPGTADAPTEVHDAGFSQGVTELSAFHFTYSQPLSTTLIEQRSSPMGRRFSTRRQPSMTRIVCTAVVSSLLVACSSPDSAGKGTETFTTWGEEFIEQGIPAGDGTSGFVDGWSLKYDKFLVCHHEITVADASGAVVAHQDTPTFVDNVKMGEKTLETFPNIPAKAYTKVSYQIKPCVANATVVAGDPGDLAMMVQNGYSFYASGTATKPDPNDASKTITKTFHWGFKTQTSYNDCHSAPENGISTEGVVITDNQTDVSQLTTHGDHLYYDSLQSGDNAKPTLIRFEEKAAADDAPTGNGDGEITIQELCKAHIDPTVYNTSGLPGATIGDFVISLARTIGHFRHEGECTIKRIDPVPPGVVNPCDEYP